MKQSSITVRWSAAKDVTPEEAIKFAKALIEKACTAQELRRKTLPELSVREIKEIKKCTYFRVYPPYIDDYKTSDYKEEILKSFKLEDLLNLMREFTHWGEELSEMDEPPMHEGKLVLCCATVFEASKKQRKFLAVVDKELPKSSWHDFLELIETDFPSYYNVT